MVPFPVGEANRGPCSLRGARSYATGACQLLKRSHLVQAQDLNCGAASPDTKWYHTSVRHTSSGGRATPGARTHEPRSHTRTCTAHTLHACTHALSSHTCTHVRSYQTLTRTRARLPPPQQTHKRVPTYTLGQGAACHRHRGCIRPAAAAAAAVAVAASAQGEADIHRQALFLAAAELRRQRRAACRSHALRLCSRSACAAVRARQSLLQGWTGAGKRGGVEGGVQGGWGGR